MAQVYTRPERRRVDWAALTDALLVTAGCLLVLVGLAVIYMPLAWIAAGLYLILMGAEGHL